VAAAVAACCAGYRQHHGLDAGVLDTSAGTDATVQLQIAAVALGARTAHHRHLLRTRSDPQPSRPARIAARLSWTT